MNEDVLKLVPKLHSSCYISKNVVLLGQIEIASGSSVWFGSVLRGDVAGIFIGKNTNLQDSVLVHTNYNLPVKIGNGVTIGHGSILHGCQIADNCLIGMGAIVLDGAKIGKNCIIGAGAIVTEYTNIPANSVVVGIPAKIIKKTSQANKKRILLNEKEYVAFAKLYKRMGK